MNSPHRDWQNRSKLRYVRWQGMAIAQFTIAIALVSTLSVAELGAGLQLLLQSGFGRHGDCTLAFVLSVFLLMLAVGLCLLATISRALDFRLTARKVRGRLDLKLFALNKGQYGRISWLAFWMGLLVFVFGSFLFVLSVAWHFARAILCGP